MNIKISPSILSADFANLEDGLHKISHADFAHVDVMDYHYVPNLTIGEPVVKRLSELDVLPLDTHLMIDNPNKWALNYADLKSKIVTFHLTVFTSGDTFSDAVFGRKKASLEGKDAVEAAVSLARKLRNKGAKAGISIKPKESVDDILPVLDEFDLVLIMTVEPGFGGQKFMKDQIPKIIKVRSEIDKRNLDVDLEVDGGINRETVKLVAQAGANMIVAGSSVYSSENPNEEVDALRKIAEENYLKLPLSQEQVNYGF